MLFLFARLSFRNLFRKYLGYSLINIIGLAAAIASVLIVAMFVHDEQSYDRHVKDAHRIYRIVLDFSNEETVTSWAKSSAPIAQHMQGLYSEIESLVRLRKNPGTDLIGTAENSFYEERIFFADSSLFSVFGLPLEAGDAATALKEPNTIVLTTSLARKIFGSTNVIGESLRFNNAVDLKITGLMKPMPSNSHFVADAFISFLSLEQLLGTARLAHWGQFDHYTYVKLREGADADAVESKFPAFLQTFAPAWVQEKEQLFLQPLLSIHLHSHRKDEIQPNSKPAYSYLLSTIGGFILLMACANFINLNTSIQVSRQHEVSVNKILGGSTLSLSLYFWLESLILIFLSVGLGWLTADVMLPYFNLHTARSLDIYNQAWIIPFLLITASSVACIAGVFPAYLAVRMQSPILHRVRYTGRSTTGLRSVLVALQLTICIFLLLATVIVSNQLSYMESQRIGFDSDRVLLIPIKDRTHNAKFETIRAELEKLEGVSMASFSSSTPAVNNALTYTYTLAGSTEGEQQLATFITDDHFFQLYNIKLLDGRLLQVNPADTLADVVLNEAAVRFFNLEDPLGTRVNGKVQGAVVGVVKDFNHASLHGSIQPVIFYPFTPSFRFVSVKLEQGKEKLGIDNLVKQWPEFFPGFPLEYIFLNDEIDRLYGSEKLLSRSYAAFAWIAVLIASIGLIGLSSYAIGTRRKEISIRKVFGGSTWGIIRWMYSGYFRWLLIASLSGCMIGYVWMDTWLAGFSSRISLSAQHFFLPVLIMVVVMLLTTGVQTIRAVQTKPVDNLREE